MKSSKNETKTEAKTSGFDQFNLGEKLEAAIRQAGFETPTPIQKQAIPLILKGNDIIGQAKTGTGKTAAFGLASLSLLNPKTKKAGILVLTPTRELATQVCEELTTFGEFLGFQSVSICGGKAYNRQIDAVQKGAQIIVATPGRLLDLLNSERIPPLNPKIVILDEADEMLDMGFLEAIKEIFTFLPKQRQTLLFSATMPPQIRSLAKKILKDPDIVRAESDGDLTQTNIHQRAFGVLDKERELALSRLLDFEQPSKSVVFCKTKREVDRLCGNLREQGFQATALHGDLEQRQRDRVTAQFKSGLTNILVATDVAARGLNIPDVTHIFNFRLPTSPESYVHRIGRTARAGKKGSSLTLFSPDEFHKLGLLERHIGSKIEQDIIPTLKDLKIKNQSKLTEKIKSQSVSQISEGLIEALKAEGLSDSDICLKLASMVLGNETFQGPERIGLSEKQLFKQASLHKPRDDKRRRRFRPGGGDRNGGGKRFGSGSGSRRPSGGGGSGSGGPKRRSYGKRK